MTHDRPYPNSRATPKLSANAIAKLVTFEKLAKELKQYRAEHRLETEYADTAANGHAGGPYDYQLEFHEAGATNQERGAIWANQIGKSQSAAAEVAMHVTGIYPKWWKGRRFDRPVIGCVAGLTNEKTRDVCQLQLMGMVEDKVADGTGWIPKENILNYTWRPGVGDVMDTIRIRHISGGVSIILMKSFEQGADKFQGDKWDFAWLDEEPKDYQVYTEALTRLLVNNGIMMFTRTPLYGLTELIRHFKTRGPGIWTTTKEWKDCPHMTPEVIERMLLSYPEHERKTRMKGIPTMGRGAAYPVDLDLIMCDPIYPMPSWWRQIVGIDFGIGHPFAACWLAYDPHTDTVYVIDEYRAAGGTPNDHVPAIRGRGDWIPCSWPHDGDNKEKGSGLALKVSYMEAGLTTMLPFSARYSDDGPGGGQARDPATYEILARMRSGRFKIYRTCTMLCEELQMLHRDDKGKIVAEDEDIESGMRYAYMMLRYAQAWADVESQGSLPRFTTDAGYSPMAALEGTGQQAPIQGDPYGQYLRI